MSMWRSAPRLGWRPSLPCEWVSWWASPYLNRFIQPDTIIPDQANPQSWNRYSYVSNNPVRFNDPTGHLQESDDYECTGCTTPPPPAYEPNYCDTHPSACGDESPDNKDVDDTLSSDNNSDHNDGGSGCQTRISNFAHGGGRWIDSWDGCGEIDPAEWELLLQNIGEDVHSYSTGWYDTPFFNAYHLSGIGCFNEGKDCYARSEINYVGEGQALAALGLTKKQTFYVVAIWKHLIYDEAPSAGTFKFTEIGWDYYHDHYSTPSHGLTPFTQMGIPSSVRILSSSP